MDQILATIFLFVVGILVLAYGWSARGRVSLKVGVTIAAVGALSIAAGVFLIAT